MEKLQDGEIFAKPKIAKQQYIKRFYVSFLLGPGSK
jgi:hypothetical protein